MRAHALLALLAAALLAAALLAGCGLPAPAPGVPGQPCGPVHRTAAPFGDEGPNLTIVALKHGTEPATLCVQVNENNPFFHRFDDPPGTQVTPNVRTLAQGRFTEPTLNVTAWIVGEEDAKVRETFTLTEESFVEVSFGGQTRLEVRKFDAPRQYA